MYQLLFWPWDMVVNKNDQVTGLVEHIVYLGAEEETDNMQI